MSVCTSSNRVLVIGDDMRIFLAVARSLGRAGKEVHAVPFNWHSPALKSRYVSKVHHVPRYSEGAGAWLSALREILQQDTYDLVIPCCDRAILPLHEHSGAFANQRIAIPGPEAMALLFDKERTRQMCAELGISVARGERLPQESTAQELAGRFGLPLVIKPRRSYWMDQLDGSGKVWIVDTEEELERVLEKLKDRSRYLVEGYFPGVGIGVSVLAEKGKIQHAFQHRRLRQGRGGCSSYRRADPVDAGLLEACARICDWVNLTGVCMFEFRFNTSDQTWILLETNARFWGSMPLPVSLGVDFPRYLYDLLVHERRHPPVSYAVGIRSRNLMLDGLNLITAGRDLSFKEIGPWVANLADFLLQPARWFTGAERSDTFVSDDLAPAFWECALLGRTIRQKIARGRNPELDRRRGDQVLGVMAASAGGASADSAS
jgi:predicted ATP-grasp superfamily ATP-dependent carboligase